MTMHRQVEVGQRDRRLAGALCISLNFIAIHRRVVRASTRHVLIIKHRWLAVILEVVSDLLFCTTYTNTVSYVYRTIRTAATAATGTEGMLFMSLCLYYRSGLYPSKSPIIRRVLLRFIDTSQPMDNLVNFGVKINRLINKFAAN